MKKIIEIVDNENEQTWCCAKCVFVEPCSEEEYPEFKCHAQFHLQETCASKGIHYEEVEED